jgi:hypothetical protein
MAGVIALNGGKSRGGGEGQVPSNKIGQLRPGQGLRRIEAQRQGGWDDQEAVDNFEIGDEMESDQSSPEIPEYVHRQAGSSNH